MRTSDYYFNVLDFGTTCAVISSRATWDNEGRVDDESLPDSLVPDGFEELAESQFEFDGSVDEARDRLLAAGFVENTGMGA